MIRLVVLSLLAVSACKGKVIPQNSVAGAPDAPTGLTVTAGNAENILLWNASATASSYQIQRSASTGGPYTAIALTASLSYTDSGLTNGTAMFYVVNGVNGTITSANSSEGTAAPSANAGAAPPAVPGGLVATAGTGAEVDLSWTAVSGATNYVLLRATAAGGPYTQVVTTDGTSYADKTVVTGTAYFFVARASAGAEQSASSAEVSVHTSGTAPPPAPTGLSAISTSTEVALSWNASTGATGYSVLRSGTSGGPYKSVATAGTTSYTDKVAVGTYFYVVTATSGSATSEHSSQVEATVSAPTSSGWLVGQGGTMRSINTGGQVAAHATVTSADLHSLTCVGIHDAWAVGASGTILYTHNGGANWNAQSSHTSVTLRGVSFTTLQHGVVVGDAGTVLLTDDAGAHWSSVAVASGADLHAVKLSANGSDGAAVGSAGTVLWTTTAGAAWSTLGAGTDTLYSVDMNSSGAAVAVGANGAAFALSASHARPLMWASPATFYSTRLLPDGSFIAVGTGGTMAHSGIMAGAPYALTSATSQDLHAVMVANPAYNGDSGILVAGANGTILAAPQVDAEFTNLYSGTSATLLSIDDLPGF